MEKEKSKQKLIKPELTEEELEKLLRKPYLTSYDIWLILPIGRSKAIEISKAMALKMKELKIFIPDSKKIIVNTKVFKKEFRI